MNQIKKVFYNLFFKKKKKRRYPNRTPENRKRSESQTSTRDNTPSLLNENPIIKPKYDLSGLKTRVSETEYIENLRIGRSWILPQMIHMGFQQSNDGKWEFSIKKFENSLFYKYNSSRKGRRELWEFILRTFKIIADRGLGSNRAKWWNIDVIEDIMHWEIYLTGKKRRGLNRKEMIHIYQTVIDYKNTYKFSSLDLYIEVERFDKCRMKKRDSSLESKLPKSFIEAFKGDGAYNAMMTMVKILGLRLKNDKGKLLSREKSIQEIENQALKLSGSQLLDYCKTHFFDSGVFEYERYV